MALTLASSVSLLPGVGAVRAGQLQDLGVETIAQLLTYIPFRMEHVETQAKLSQLPLDQTVCIRARVTSIFPIRSARFAHMIKATIADESGSCQLTWFHNTYILSLLKEGQEYYFLGKVGTYKNTPTLINPTVSKDLPLKNNTIPIYHESATITSKFLSKLVASALSSVGPISDDPDSESVRAQLGLPTLSSALSTLHGFSDPQDEQTRNTAIRRLALDEVYTLLAHLLKQKKEHEQSRARTILQIDTAMVSEFLSHIPFTPTQSQQDAIRAVAHDLAQKQPMYRLLQGEVGSGKTLVAAFALWCALQAGKRAYLLCPTNILASQHASSIRTLLAWDTSIPSIGLYTGKEKDLDASVIIGTHALLTHPMQPDLLIVDEEHRFGVEQREHFFDTRKKPHFLSMTATPIPRTIALTALADRDISIITPHKSSDNIRTWVVPLAKRESAYEWIKKTLRESDQQALIVCPFIEESAQETLNTVKSAKKEFETLQSVFAGFTLALMHGKMKAVEKDRIFSDMLGGKMDILVTTPVVEVGVDIPKASIILIEGVERYGLASLHQLRGRVGRRGQTAYCLLFATQEEQEHTARLSYFAKTYDGNALAEYDLHRRGSGDLLGVKQHGFDSFRFASWFDHELFAAVKHTLQA